jgi:hypothetical protein
MPVTHALGDMVQFIRFLRGEIVLPPQVKLLTGMNEHFRPLPSAGDFADVDVALVEPNTPTEILYGDFLLQRNAVISHIIDPIRIAHPDPAIAKMAGNWFMQGLISGNEATRLDLGSKLAALVPPSPMADVARDVLLTARGERRDVEEGLRALQAVLHRPIGLLTYIYQYMPDGRPVSWPAGFRDDLLHAAGSMKLPIFEPWTLVERVGVKVALTDDLRHYRDAFMLPIGEAMVSFAGEVVRRAGKPRGSPMKDNDPRDDDVDGLFVERQDLNQTPTAMRLSPTRLADRINAELIKLHSGRLAQLGLDESGLFAHYAARIERGVLVGPIEKAALEVVSTWLPPYDGFGVLRAGLGELALLLAASGRRVTAFEPNLRRRAALQAGQAHFLEIGLIGQGMIDIFAVHAPDTAPRGRILGVGLDVVTVKDEAAARPLMMRLTAFEGLLVDLRQLFRLREDSEERSAAAATLTELGFTLRKDFSVGALVWMGKPTAAALTDAPSV